MSLSEREQKVEKEWRDSGGIVEGKWRESGGKVEGKWCDKGMLLVGKGGVKGLSQVTVYPKLEFRWNVYGN